MKPVELDESELGPCMRALRPRWQVAVLALFANRGNRTAAYRAAGFKSTNDTDMYSRASRFFRDERVIAAVREVASATLQIEEPESIGVVHDIMRDVTMDAKDRLMAVRTIWDRTRPMESKVNIDVTHKLTIEETEVQHYRALQKLGAPKEAFIGRFGHNGLSRVEALVAIEDKRQAATIGGRVIETTEYEEIENTES